MKKSCTVFAFAAAVMLFFSSARAQSPDELTFNFYSGLAEVIKANTSAPAQCVTEVKKYVEAHRADLKQIRQNMEEAMNRVKAGKPPALTEEEAGQALEQSSVADAVNRFTEAFSAFSMENPQEAAEIEKLIQQG